MKNLSVDMPLAVPHQKPPSRYASHPYPIYFLDSASVIGSMTGAGVMLSAFKDTLSVNAALTGSGELRSILVEVDIGNDQLLVHGAITGIGELKKKVEKIKRLYKTSDVMNINGKMVGSGKLLKLLIAYRHKAEEIKVSAKIIGIGELK